MICPYCNKKLTKNKESYKYYSYHYDTYICLNHSEFLNQLELRFCNNKLERIIMNNIITCNLSVFLFPLDNKTFIYYYDQQDIIPCIVLNSILSISPDNFLQKIKTLITFS